MKAELEILERVSLAISALRARLGITQYQLAQRLNRRERYIQRWENGKVMPTGDSMLKLLQPFCPDRESLAEFGLDISHLQGQYSKPHVAPKELVPDLVDRSPIAKRRPDGRLIPKYLKSGPKG